MKNVHRDDDRIAEIVTQKLDLKVQIRELRTQLANLNKDLLRAGGDIAEISAW